MFFLSDRLIWLVLEKIFVKHAILKNYWFGSVQLLSHVQLFVTLWTAACQASLYIAFHFVYGFLYCAKAFLLWYMSHFFCLFVCFIAFAFCVKSKIKNPHQNQCQVAYHLHFHLKVLWFHVLFSSLISFDMVFLVYGVSRVSISFFCTWPFGITDFIH